MNARLRTYLVMLVMMFTAPRVWAQEQHYTVAFQGASLQEALERVVHATGMSVAYDAELIRGYRTYCVIEDEPLEPLLQCLLRNTDLDFYRLSSGTYVLRRKVEVQPVLGYLTGVVADWETGQPLAGAHVLLADAGFGTTTNRAGQFTFPPLLPGRYRMDISHVSYRTWRDTVLVVPGSRTVQTADLRSDPIIIAPIIVDGLQQRLPSVQLSGSELNLQQNPGPGISDATRAVQNISGVRVNEATADVHIQGGEAGEHQFRIDGVPVFLPRRVVGFIGPFSPFALQRLRVHRAGFGVAHGSQTAGVIEAEHRLADRNSVDVQFDPISLNARLELTTKDDIRPTLSLMLAGRTDLRNVYQPQRLQQVLDTWSTPDPFLLLAPLGAYRLINPDFLSEFLLLKDTPAPTLNFSDLHAALRARIRPLHQISASGYRGTGRLSGSLRPDEASFDAEAVSRSPFLSIEDAYAWSQQSGQIRYDAVPGNHALVGLQIRTSTYRLNQRYELLESLDAVRQADFLTPTTLNTRPVHDHNRIIERGVVGTFNYIRGAHHLEFGLEALHTHTRFDLLMAGLMVNGDPSNLRNFSLERRRIRNTTARWQWNSYLQDRWQWGQRTEATVGVRLTYLPNRATVYAEPRLSIRYDHDGRGWNRWSMQTAAGLYRQYVNQFDLSSLNAGALLPSVRIWLPLDASVRPPVAYHVTQSLLWQPHPTWTLRGNAFYKYHPHGLTINYATRIRGDLTQQSDFLASTEGYAYGGGASAEWKVERIRAQVQYAYSVARRKSEVLFGGATISVPWNQPHQLHLAMDWTPTPAWVVSTRWQGVWHRAWGFRRAYYDYFAHLFTTRIQAPFDIGRPSTHILPPLYQLDLSVAYSHRLGPASLQMRLDMLNVLGRRNVADWRIVQEDGEFRRSPRYLYPRMPVVAVRMTW